MNRSLLKNRTLPVSFSIEPSFVRYQTYDQPSLLQVQPYARLRHLFRTYIVSSPALRAVTL